MQIKTSILIQYKKESKMSKQEIYKKFAYIVQKKIV